MIVANLDELMAVFDVVISDKARQFATDILLNDALLEDDAADVLDGCQALQTEVMTAWRAEMRGRLAALPIQFPVRLQWARRDPPRRRPLS